MALTGVHVVCAPVNNANGASLQGTAQWSQTMASAGTTSQSAPNGGNMMFEVRTSADIWFAIGPTPDATNGPRWLLAASDGPRQLLAFPGDKLAWIVA